MRRGLVGALLACAFLAAALGAGAMETTQANIHFNLALRQYQSQKLDDAKASLAKALGLVPEHPQANLLLGIIDCQQGKFDQAIGPLKLAQAGLPTNPDPWNNLGVAYFQLGRVDDAANAFEQVLALKPDSPDVAMNLGVLRLRQKRFGDAEKAFSTATAGANAGVKAWLGLAEAADGAGDVGRAMAAREKALEMTPADKALRLDLGQRLYSAGDLSQAATVLQPLQDAGDSGAEFLLGVLAYRRGDFNGSRARFQAALALRPDYPEARFNLAITDYDQGLFPEALSQFQAVLDKHPNDDEARKNLEVTRQAAVHAWLEQGSNDFLKADYASALAHWKQALDLDKGNKVVKDLVDTAQAQLKLQADDLASAGKQAWAAGQKEAGIRDWAQALERDPSNADAIAGLAAAKDEVSRLATAYGAQADGDLANGRLERARDEVQRVKALDPARGSALALRVEKACRVRFNESLASADAAAKRGALASQVDALTQALEAEPEDGPTQLKLNQAKVAWRQALDAALDGGQKADKAGRTADAVKDYRRVLELQPGHPVALAGLKRLEAKGKAQGVDPAMLDDLYYKGVYAYAGGDVKKAEECWRKVLQEDPKHALAREALNRSERRAKALKAQH